MTHLTRIAYVTFSVYSKKFGIPIYIIYNQYIGNWGAPVNCKTKESEFVAILHQGKIIVLIWSQKVTNLSRISDKEILRGFPHGEFHTSYCIQDCNMETPCNNQNIRKSSLKTCVTVARRNISKTVIDQSHQNVFVICVIGKMCPVMMFLSGNAVNAHSS